MDPAGLVAIAMAGLWIAYLVPQRLQYRQQLLDSRTDDRFSGGLRVLRVAAGPEGPRPVQPGTRSEQLSLHQASGTAARGGGGSVNRPHAAGDRLVADAVRRSAAEHAQRAAYLSRRAAAARRRAALTALLLLLVVVGWSVVGFAGAVVTLGAVPSALLVTVLVLGRRAVVAGARADAAWAAGGTDRVLLQRAVRAGIVGRAVHPSEATTQVMPRIPAQRRQSALGADRDLAQGAAQGAAEVRAASTQSDEGSDTTWAPVPVPRPTYTLKGSAPRREPAPLTAEDLAPASSADAQQESQVDDTQAEPGSAAETAAGGTPATGASAGGLDLDEILARRRASGE